MLSIYKTVEGELVQLQSFEKDAWVHLHDPEDEEIQAVVQAYSLEEDFVRAALDEEERARIETEQGQMLVIVDIPVVANEETDFVYTTLPMGIVYARDCIVTVCMDETTIIEDFMEGRVRDFFTFKKTRFILQLLYKNAIKYLQFLRQIDKVSNHIEQELHKSMKNRELIQMLRLEKSLVYFSTSLKSNEVVMEKLLRLEMLKKYPDDADLLEDVIIENKQAIEMCAIFRDILSGTMDAFASVISNNLNIVMKFLASVTIIIAIPSMFAAFWGMNTGVPWEGSPVGFWAVVGLSIVAAGITCWLLWRKKML